MKDEKLMYAYGINFNPSRSDTIIIHYSSAK